MPKLKERQHCTVCQRPGADQESIVDEEGDCYEPGGTECRKLGDTILQQIALCGPFILDVIEERIRQMVEHGYHEDHDDGHKFGELGNAAAYCLLEKGARHRVYGVPGTEFVDVQLGDRYDHAVKGAALALAEGARLDRARE